MPVAGFKVGDRVLTPAGKKATVVAVKRRSIEIVRVRYDTDPEHRVEREFRAAALRLERAAAEAEQVWEVARTSWGTKTHLRPAGGRTARCGVRTVARVRVTGDPFEHVTCRGCVSRKH